jgi:hypothetical protein
MMTLRNMREHGVHSLAIRCGALWCNHEGVLDVSAFADGLTVPSFRPTHGLYDLRRNRR